MPPPKPTPAPRVKVNKTELKRRVNEVYKLLVSAARREDIIAKAEKLEWGVQPRQIDVYIRKAREQMALDSAIERAEQVSLADAQLEFLQAKATTVGDLNNAIKARAERSKLRGLHAPQKIETVDLTPRAWEILGKIEALATRHNTTVETILAHVADSLEGSEAK
jgi:hypothetical protein